MENKKHILSLTQSELEEVVLSFGEKKYRALQILEGLYAGKNLSELNIPQNLKDNLNANFSFPQIEIVKTYQSTSSETVKHLFKLFDGSLVEGVVMKYKYGNSFCVSCQVGCKMGCKFCTSGSNGFKRNLEAGEIVEMVLLAGGRPKQKELSNIVMMGSGEPLDNYEQVIKFLEIATNPKGLNFSQRSISVSTCGVVPRILDLAKSGIKVTLSISLHASNQKSREMIMPIAKKYDIKKVVDASKKYFEETGRRVLFEYVMIDGINDSEQNALELSKLLKGFSCHVNLISLNAKKGSTLKAVDRDRMYAFLQKLKSLGVEATIRRVLGDDIKGACGQLVGKILEGEEVL